MCADQDTHVVVLGQDQGRVASCRLNEALFGIRDLAHVAACCMYIISRLPLDWLFHLFA
jgi:hypothetical protein